MSNPPKNQPPARGAVVRLIEAHKGPRSMTRVGRAIGIDQLGRSVGPGKRLPEWSVVTALANHLDVEVIEVVAAFAADSGVTLGRKVGASWSSAQRRAAALVGSLPEAEQPGAVDALSILLARRATDD